MKPAGSSATLIHYGNTPAPVVGYFAGMDNRVGSGGPTMAPPGFTSPRLPILEKITPRSINASKITSTAQARARVGIVTASKRATGLAFGIVRGLGMRQFGQTAAFSKGVRSLRATLPR